MTAPDTDTLAGLLADASPGPWEWAGIYRGDVHHLVHWVPGETFPNGDPRYIAIPSDGSAAGEYGPDIDVTGADARLIALAPELAAETIALRARATKDKARIERLEAALREISNCGQSAEPDHWKFRCMAREKARTALKDKE